jgi:hypothetical protein
MFELIVEFPIMFEPLVPVPKLPLYGNHTVGPTVGFRVRVKVMTPLGWFEPDPDPFPPKEIERI